MFKTLIRLFFRYLYRFRPPETVKYGKLSGFAKAKVTKAVSGALQMEIGGEKYPFPGFPRQHVLMGGSLQKFKLAMKNKSFHVMWGLVPDKFEEEDLSPFLKDIFRVFGMLKNAEVTGDMKSEVWNLGLAHIYYLHKGKDTISAEDIMAGVSPSIEEARYDMLPIDQCCSFVKEIWYAIKELEKIETDKSMRDFLKIFRIGFCNFMQEDDAWRFRWQWVFERLNKKIYKKYNIAHLSDSKDYQTRFQFVLSHMDYNKSKLSKADMYFARGKWFKPDLYTKRGNIKFEY